MVHLLYFLLLFQPYERFNCSEFVCATHRARCSAAELYNGCGGKLQQVGTPQVGDVVAYGGRHVAIYLGPDRVLDSTPEHGVSIHKPLKNDPWYRGPVKFLRWR